ncbi:carbohydrate ABC transporter permease [Nesterenkonia sp. AY15]|uniref:carbohydrate ABC transporter permease n=1 Tax=Nesterenkonia sp. AY15 TaxID=2901139 RepID=UPI001F4CB435|nr:carbohydrate ABC transporter permease [Nesterenkonia sp. AY15]MCH8572221.1 carbohydrate ABC transporter permease [Nesterenkonia sp. AY15]
MNNQKVIVKEPASSRTSPDREAPPKTREYKTSIIPSWVRKRIIWIPLAFAIVWSAVPIAWALLASFKPASEINQTQSTILPQDPTFASYISVLSDGSFWMFTGNSLIVSVTSTVLAVAVSSVAAYGFARYAFKWRHTLLLFILIPRLVPRVSLIVPLYEMLTATGLLNTYAALIIIYAGTAIPLATWIMMGFVQAVPREIDEAGKIDGASTWQTFTKLVLPLTIPGLLTITVLSFREAWNEFPFVLALTTGPELRTLPYGLYMALDSTGIQDWSYIQAFTMLSIIPIILLYIRFEKHVVAGLSQGAVK